MNFLSKKESKRKAELVNQLRTLKEQFEEQESATDTAEVTTKSVAHVARRQEALDTYIVTLDEARDFITEMTDFWQESFDDKSEA